MNFISEVVPINEKSNEDLCFAFYNNKILVKIIETEVSIPTWEDLHSLAIKPSSEHYLGVLNGRSCYAINIAEEMDMPNKTEFRDLRSVGTLLDEEFFLVCGKASQILNWHETHQYCGRCGNKTEVLPNERAMVCPRCNLICYPRISPAVIVAVTKGDKILLAHNNNFAKDLYSVLAGFVEPGEPFELCVEREVYEEVGIKVKNIKYFTSQPWPFPNSLMVAFTAEYDEGEIKVDGKEIGYANWFKVGDLPTLPSKISVARKLIDNFIKNQDE